MGTEIKYADWRKEEEGIGQLPLFCDNSRNLRLLSVPPSIAQIQCLQFM
jgi:hypothetical protein